MLVEELTGQEVQIRSRTHHSDVSPRMMWEDGVAWTVVADAVRSVIEEHTREGDPDVMVLRRLSHGVRVQVVTAAWLAEQARVEAVCRDVSANRTLPGGESLSQVHDLILEECSQVLTGARSRELRLPVSHNPRVAELAAIVTACEPETDHDLTLVPVALETALAALAEV